jgi:hypothetical protein
MARVNQPFISFNRGLVSPKALARVDLDRTKLSAEVFTNWLPKTQGAMTLRPGTKHFGSSLNDTGAEWIEFVASTDDVALCELTHQTMRIWLGDDAHSLSLLERPAVDTRVSITDTGWSDASTGGTASISTVDAIPAMTGSTTSGVTITASSQNASLDDGDGGGNAFHIGDNNLGTEWHDTGDNHNSLPSWVMVDFGSPKSIARYSVRASSRSSRIDSAPDTWQLQGNDVDTGNGWTTEDTQGSETGWGTSEKRTYTIEDSGTPGPWRYWRLNVTGVDTDLELVIAEIEMFEANVNTKVTQDSNGITLNASAIGSLARARKRVMVDTGDRGVEHSLAIAVARGPVVFRVGSTAGDDDYVSETSLGTGYHNLAFTPSNDFHITMQTDAQVNRVVSSIEIGDSGTVEIAAPWDSADLGNIRYDQSADVVYVDCDGVRPSRIERRGTGRSWSVVDYAPSNGPFLAFASSQAKMQLSHFFGNTDLTSDVPFFSPGHVGALARAFHEGQGGQWRLGALDAATDPIEVIGITLTDTGSTLNIVDDTGSSDRNITFDVSGTWSGRLQIERSIDGPKSGFKAIPTNFSFPSASASDTGTFFRKIVDRDDNVKAHYRARLINYTSGVAIVKVAYSYGGVTGIARITGYNSNTNVDVEVISRFSDTGPTANWQEGYWSEARSFPTAVALHGGRLFHANGGNLFGSVADDYENFDQATIGDAGPIIRTLGSGPVDNIHYLISLLRLVIGTAGAELALTSSSLDEPVTPANSNARNIGTQGGANLRAVKMDTKAIMTQRSRQRVFMIGPNAQGSAFGDYESFELTLLVPDLLAAGVVSIAVQRQPDTRIHCVLADGRVGILTYEPQEEVICWSMWETDGAVEKAMVLPGLGEDAVFYHVRRTIGGANDDSTVVLLHLDGADASTLITDANAGGSARSWAANGNAQLDTGDSKFGSALLLDGTGDYLSADASSDFDFGTGDFTIDFWVRRNGVQGNFDGLVSGYNGTTGWHLPLGATGTLGTTNAPYFSNGSAVVAASSTVLPDGAWQHVAAVRSGNSLLLFQDGVLTASADATGASFNSAGAGAVIGRLRTDQDAAYFAGHIDELRISKGIARWTTAFTPPTRAYAPDHVRYLEKWAMESECLGDTGLTWLIDCARSYTDTGRTATLTGFEHLAGRSVAVWSSDTGSFPGVDRSPDVDGVQTLYTVDTGTGQIGLSVPVHHAVAGLPYTADWKSTKLAYAAEAGTALAQMKRTDKIGFVLYQAHNNALFYGSDTGRLSPLPRKIDAGAAVDQDKIFAAFDKVAMAFPGLWDTDSRIHLRAKAPRPVTVLAAIPTVQTNEKI